MGDEPTRPAWKAGILPLNYTRITELSISPKLRIVNTFFEKFSYVKQLFFLRARILGFHQ